MQKAKSRITTSELHKPAPTEVLIEVRWCYAQ